MTQNTDSGLTDGAVGSPNQPSPLTQDTLNSIDVDALAKRLTPVLDEMIDRRFKSGKDKRIHGLETQMTDFQSQLARLNELKADGYNEKQALHMMSLEEQLGVRQADGSSGQAAQPGKVGSPTVASSADYAGFASDLGLSINDSEVLAAIQEGSRPDVYRKLISISDKRKAPVAPTNPAPLPVSGGLPVAGEATLEDVTRDLNAEMSKPVLDMPKIRALRDKQALLLPRK